MTSYAKYSLVPTDEPDKTGLSGGKGAQPQEGAGVRGGIFCNLFTSTHKPPSINQSTLPAPPRSAFDYSSAFNFKSAFDYNTGIPSHYQSAFDYGYTRKETGLHKDVVKKTKNRTLGAINCDATQCLSFILAALSYIFILLTFPVTLPFCFKRLAQWERIVVFRLGILRGVFGPGMVFVIPWSDRINRVDMRTKAFSVPPQQVITCDNGIVEVGCEVKYRVSDVKRLTTSVTSPEHGLRNFGKTVLLNVLTKHSVKEMERDRHGMASQVQRDLNSRVLEWGIEIGQIDLSQVTVLKEPEPNDPLKPLLGALGSLAGGGACMGAPGPGKTTFAIPPGAEGAMGGLGKAASLLSGLLAGAKQTPAAAADTSIINIPGLAGTEGGEPQVAPSYGAVDNKQQMVAESGPPKTAFGQYLNSLVAAAGPNDLTHGIYRLAVDGTPQGGTAVFIIFVGAGVRQVVEGDLPSVTPDVSVSISQEDLYAIFSGSLPPLQAYLSGRLSVQGSVQMLMGLQALQDVHQTLAQKNAAADNSFVV